MCKDDPRFDGDAAAAGITWRADFVVPIDDHSNWGITYDDGCWLLLRPPIDGFVVGEGWESVAWIPRQVHDFMKTLPSPREWINGNAKASE